MVPYICHSKPSSTNASWGFPLRLLPFLTRHLVRFHLRHGSLLEHEHLACLQQNPHVRAKGTPSHILQLQSNLLRADFFQVCFLGSGLPASLAPSSEFAIEAQSVI